MKRITSILICFLLAFSVYVPAAGVSSEEKAVSAVPINSYTVKRTGVIGGTVYPLEGYSLKGEIADRLLPWNVAPDCLSKANNAVLAFNSMAQPLNGSEGIMFYLSIPAENTIAFVLELESPKGDSRWDRTYDPEMSPYVGQSVMLLRDGADSWEETSFVKTLPQAEYEYKCGITFDEAFSGWVKVPYSSLGSDDKTFKFDAAKDTLKNIPFRFSKLGGDYGAVTVGPLMLMTEDGTAPEVLISDEYKTGDTVTAYAPTDYTINSGTLHTEESYLTDKGNAKLATLTGGSANDVRQLCYKFTSEELGHTDGLAVYLDLSAASSFTAHITLNFPEDGSRWGYSYPPQLLLCANNDYYLLSEETGRWQKGTVGLSATGEEKRGLISIESAFKGWLIIPYDSFANDGYYKFIPEKDTAQDICVSFSEIDTTVSAAAWIGFKAEGETDYTSGAETSVEVVDRYALTVGDTENGSLSLSRKTAAAGERVEVTVTPDGDYRQAADGLKLNYTYAGSKKTELITKKADSEIAGEGEGNSFYFTMPAADATVTAELVSTDILDPVLLEPTAVGDSAFRLGLRLYAENENTVTAGFLITDKETAELSHSSVARGVTELICSRRYDESSPENGGIKYCDYTVVLDGIINPAKQYTLRGYAAYYEGGVKKYRYTEQITLSFNDTVTEEMPALADFGEPTVIESNSAVKYELTESPDISLSNSSAVKLYTDDGYSCPAEETNDSALWLTANYKPFSLDGVTDIILYVKVPAAKANKLYLNLKNTDGYDYKLWAHRSYYIAAVGDKKWTEKKTSEAKNTTNGLIDLPAGFEGFIRVPLTSLYEPSKVNGSTSIKAVIFRFSYIDTAENPITVAPVFGAYASGGRDAVKPTVLAELYSKTAGTEVYTAKSQMFADSGIFYWSKAENAESYLITAYEKKGGSYISRASYRVYSNSGAVTGLEANTEYTVQIAACDKTEAPIAYYEPFNVKTAAENATSAVTKTDAVYTAASGKSNASVVFKSLSAGSEALLDGNPNRGLRGCMEFYHFTDRDAIKKQLDKYVANNVYTTVSTPIYVCYIYPGDYRGETLDSTFFSSLQYIFDYCREKQIQLLLRFAYYDNNNFNDRTPTTEELLSHINQLAENGIIVKNKDILHTFQAGFVGKYGEWHSDEPKADRAQVINAIIEKLLPNGIYSQVRMQNYKQYLPSEEYKTRFGIHLDSYFGIMDGSELGGGTFSYGNPEWDECVKTAALTPNDAELYYWGQFNNMGMYCEGYAAALGAGQLCLTTLSGVNGYTDTTAYSESCMGQWKKLPVTREWLEFNNLPYADGWFTDSSGNAVYRTVFEYIRDHLGYKITATELKTSTSGNSLSAELKLCNNGFSAAFNLEASLVLLNSSGAVVATGDTSDAASLTTGEHTLKEQFTLSASGEYTLALLLKSKSGASARLDNEIPFENGYNILYKFTKE